MAPSIRIKNISELPIISGSRNDTRKKISCITIGYREAEEQFSSDIHLDAFIILLVLSGKGHTVINYKAYDIQADTLLLLSSAHLFHFMNVVMTFNANVSLSARLLRMKWTPLT